MSDERRIHVSSLSLVVGLCPPLSKELHVGTIIHTVPTASTYNTKVRFPNCIVQRVFLSRAREDRTIFFAAAERKV
jgi:hypothetical protein